MSKNGNSLLFRRKIGFTKEFSNSFNFSESLLLSSLISVEIAISSFSLRFKESLFLLYVKLYLFNAGEFFKVNKLFNFLSFGFFP